MTTTPDPQLVQELATELMLDAAREVDYMGIGERYFDDERCADLDDEQKEALQYAISDFISEATIVVTAPAEQPQDDGDVRAVAMRAFLDLHAERRGHDLIASLAVGDGRTLELTRSGLARLLDENKRLRELATRPTDGLVLAPKDQCAALLAYDRTVIRCERIGDHWPALHTARFGDGARVEWRDPEPSIEVDAALEARDAKPAARERVAELAEHAEEER